jgi:3-isopropylmalate dehydrogenase
MFEPIGGSAPKYTGKNMINPLAAIAALAMLLDFLGEESASHQVEEAVKKVVKDDMKSMDAGRMGHTTQEVGNLVAKYIAEA